MKSRRLTDDLSSSGQITTDDLPLIHAMGFKAIICCRPDGEAIDQQLYEIISKVAEKAGLQSRYLPIDASGPTPEDKTGLCRALEELPKPIFAYSVSDVSAYGSK